MSAAALLMAAANGASNGKDAFFGNVSLLLHGDGTNGSTTVPDTSGSPKTMTCHGGAQLATAQKKFGTASIKFAAAGDTISTPNDAAFQWGSGDFTIEAFVYPTAFTNSEGIVVGIALSGVDNLFEMWTDTSGHLKYQNHPNNLITSSSTLSLNTWQHVAVSRQGTTTRMFIDGTQVGSVADSFAYAASPSYALAIGGDSAGASPTQFYGYVDELRLTKGFARYTGAFTAPTAAFQDS